MKTVTVGADRPKPAGALGFYLVAVMSMAVSVDTSWRFFGDVLGITDTAERVVMFTVVEVALIACGYGMRANVRRTGRPGAPRLVAWVLCGMAGYMAWQLSGVAEGLARVVLGPVLGLVMLHLALGIEIRAGSHTATTWARVGRELRERVLSRLGLSDDERDALARTRDRAARRAARLALGGFVPFRTTRVARALRASHLAHDPAARARMLAELATIRHAAELATLDQPSPWQSTTAGDGASHPGQHTHQPAEPAEPVARPAATTAASGGVGRGAVGGVAEGFAGLVDQAERLERQARAASGGARGITYREATRRLRVRFNTAREAVNEARTRIEARQRADALMTIKEEAG